MMRLSYTDSGFGCNFSRFLDGNFAHFSLGIVLHRFWLYLIGYGHPGILVERNKLMNGRLKP